MSSIRTPSGYDATSKRLYRRYIERFLEHGDLEPSDEAMVRAFIDATRLSARAAEEALASPLTTEAGKQHPVHAIASRAGSDMARLNTRLERLLTLRAEATAPAKQRGAPTGSRQPPRGSKTTHTWIDELVASD
jgi:phage terminase small subunit